MTALTKTREGVDIPFFTSVPPKEKDLPALGFASFAEYRLWCLREGYEDGLGRSKPERQQASPIPSMEKAPHDTEERREAIRQTVAGEVDGRSEAYGWLEGDEEGKQALLRLMLHVNHYMDVLKRKRLHWQIGRYRE
jgi:hypothetical protein